jgi:hypothetical protein
MLPNAATVEVPVAAATLCSTVYEMYSSNIRRIRWNAPKLGALRRVKSRRTKELQKRFAYNSWFTDTKLLYSYSSSRPLISRIQKSEPMMKILLIL